MNKKCTVCNIEKPATKEYFYRVSSASSELRGKCKSCASPGARKRNKPEDILTRYSVDENGCWNYTMGKDSFGYGRFYIQQRSYPAHRIMYELKVGLIGPGLVLDHLCRNKSCINPEHLEPVTQLENVKRYHRNLHCKTCRCKKGD